MTEITEEELATRLEDDLPYTLQPRAVCADVPDEFFPTRARFVLNCGSARTPGGRFWCCWGGGEDGPLGYLLIAWSDDEGRTWTAPKFMLDGGATPHGFHLTNRVGALWCAPTGVLHLFFLQTLGYADGRSGVWETRCLNPDSPDPQWETPRRLWHGTPLNKPCVRRNGEWILPVSLSLRRHARFFGRPLPERLFRELDPIRGANVIVSADGGRIWEHRGFQRSTDPLFDEHHILEKTDGTLKLYARDQFGAVSCESSGGGRFWTPFRRELFTASARTFMTALPSGNWLWVRHNTEKPDDRRNLTAYVSCDEGRTWRGGLLLDERCGVSYPDGFVHPDGRIFVQYDHLRTNGELLMTAFREEDALARRNVSGAVIEPHPTIRT